MADPPPDPPAPAALGRGVVVPAGAAAPAPWAGAPRVLVGEEALARPQAVVGELHAAWAGRTPVVVELAVDPVDLRRPQVSMEPPWRLGPGFEFTGDRLQFLVWANNYDARSGDLVWWHGRKARRTLGLEASPSADVVLADGTAAYVDGGPPLPPAVDGAAVVHRWSAEAGRPVPAGHGAPSAELADDQRAAVGRGAGPVRVIAPAGSGKTRVLTERLRHLLADRRVDPSTVTAVAYNTKAAAELRARCQGLGGAGGPSIRTLNSLGLWLCNEFGGDGRLVVAEENRCRDLIGQLFEVKRRANQDTAVPYLEGLSAIRLGLRDPEEVEDEIGDAGGLADGFDRYRSALAERGWVDFDEQIYRAVEILLRDPAARAAAQATCRHLLVDEFQDLNPAHLLLLRLLAAPQYECFGVGDDDQVLYGYAGATPEYLVHFDRYFPGAGSAALEVNYRCPPAVVTAAGHLLSYNTERVDKTVRAARPADEAGPEGGAVVVRRAPADALATEAAGVVAGWRDEGVVLEQVAVLARVNAALLPAQVALTEAGIPCRGGLGEAVLNRTGVRTAFAYLRIGADPGAIARQDVADTVRRPSRGIAPMVVDMLTRPAVTSLHDVRRLARRLTGRDADKVAAYADDLELVAASCTTTVAALRCIREDVGLGDTMDALDGSRRDLDRSPHADDLAALESVASLHPDPETFESWLRAGLRRGRPQAADEDGDGAVLLSTVHRIKGREWDRVLLVGASTGMLPHRLSDDEEGERRVLHVALTRARRQIVLLADAAAPSPFLEELDGTRPHRPRTPAPRPKTPQGGPRPAAGRPAGVPEPASPEESLRREALRAWRATVAARDGVPAYIVLSDRDLAGIAAAAPASLRALARCRGIGPNKLDRWGDEILAVLGPPH